MLFQSNFEGVISLKSERKMHTLLIFSGNGLSLVTQYQVKQTTKAFGVTHKGNERLYEDAQKCRQTRSDLNLSQYQVQQIT
jgi:hypothetical protein